ncbi:MAG: PIN domain-containing protein [Candidatus Brockarchaeota archaeon]|nr:PIN domain-containing protein [Candidatus Brockarchaeota archaeon]
MGKRSRDNYPRKLILDTSFILPYLGIRVISIEEEDLEKITENYELHYPLLLLVELQGVVFKEAKKLSLKEIPKKAINGFISLVYGEHVKMIPPAEEDLNTSYDLISSGWNDIFDAILYAVSKRTRIKVLTMDTAFRKFLKENKFDQSNSLP